MSFVISYPTRRPDFLRLSRQVADRQKSDAQNSSWRPVADIDESSTGWFLSIELPGVGKKDMDIKVESGVLKITGSRKGPENANYRLKEARYGEFSRSFRMPKDVNTEDIVAAFDNGVLKVTVPKPEPAIAHRIPLQIGTLKTEKQEVVTE